MDRAAAQFLTQTYRQPLKPAELKRVGADEPEAYDDFLWELARKFTSSHEEALAAVEEMQNDVQRCAENVGPVTKKQRFAEQLAWLRLKRFLR